MSDLEEAYDDLTRELGLARELLSLARAQELRKELREVRPLAIIRDQYGPIRAMVRDYANKISETALPLLIVFCVYVGRK